MGASAWLAERRDRLTRSDLPPGARAAVPQPRRDRHARAGRLAIGRFPVVVPHRRPRGRPPGQRPGPPAVPPHGHAAGVAHFADLTACLAILAAEPSRWPCPRCW
ncbi:MAG: hypothetical protein R2746_04560 [Acidimicrobiales bacterium]